MKKLLLVLMLLAQPLEATIRYVTQAGSGTQDGTSRANAWSIAYMNSNQGATDTCYLYGTITSSITLNASGTLSQWVMIRNEPGQICSVYTTYPFNIDQKNYVVIRGIAFRATYGSYYEHAHYVWIDSCRFYGPSTGATGGYQQVMMDSVWYFRFTSSFFDRESPEDIDVPYEGDGLRLEHSCRYFTIENNTFTRVSHATIGLDAGVHGWNTINNAYGVVRNNLAYWNHTGPGQSYKSGWNLFEGNTTYWNGHALARAGGTFQFSGFSSIHRFNIGYNDSSQNSPLGSPKRQTSMLSMASSNNNFHEFRDTRTYNNTFWGYEKNTERDIYTVMFQDDSWEDTDNDFSHNHLRNNLIGGGDTNQVIINSYDVAVASFTWEWKNNCIYHGTSTAEQFQVYFQDWPDWTDVRKTLTQMEAQFSGWTGNFDLDPQFAEPDSRGSWRNFATATGSPLRNAGIALATIPLSYSDSRIEVDSIDYTNNRIIPKSGSSFVVTDAMWFWFPEANMSWERGDSLLIRGDSVYVLATWNSVTQTYVQRLSGSRPDVGAYEFFDPPPIEDSTTKLMFYN